MILLMYHSQMLSREQIDQIPRTTRNDWDRFLHQDYFGYEMVKEYIADFDEIKHVLVSKHLKHGIKVLFTLSNGYKDIIGAIEGNKQLLRKHADRIILSTQSLARCANISVARASRLMGINHSWFYRHRKKTVVRKAGLGNVLNNTRINYR